jgi:hypothetical protein
MRRSTAWVAAALLVAGILVAGAGAASLPGPQIAITGAQVKTVHGTGFKAHERVRIAMRSVPGMTRVRHATTGARGRFSATFRTFRLSGCGSAFSVVVTGSKGSSARLAQKVIPKLMCAD